MNDELPLNSLDNDTTVVQAVHNSNDEMPDITLIPGVRQDHNGNCYSYERNNNNGDLKMLPAAILPLSEHRLQRLERVLVHSRATGHSYWSMRCYQ